MYYLNNTFSVTKAELRAVLAHANKDDDRPHLNGVCFECDGVAARLVASNGRTLLVCERAIDNVAPVAQRFIPLAVLVQAARLLRTQHHELRVCFDAATVRLSAVDGKTTQECGYVETPTLTDVPFPPYDQVIPQYTKSGQPGDPAGVVSLNGNYLASAALLSKAVDNIGVSLMVGADDLAPLVITAGGSDDTQFTLIIMPMRGNVAGGYREIRRQAQERAAA